jgi:dolichyl-phosphate-mannose--protein O-mannosyl transferase
MAASPASSSPGWYRWGLVAIFLGCFGLRFWGLERFNTLVFDEVYYAKFANNYLTQTPFFDGHPPLSKYLVALGMWLGNQLPIAQDVANNLTGSWRTTWSYRWLNALAGSCLPLVIAALAYQLSQRYRFALIAALFAAMDGLFLVESRYALNNIYLVLFGLLGQLCLLVAARACGWKSWMWLSLAGLGFAASISIKWNGLWFLLGAYGVLAIAWLMARWYPRRAQLPTPQNLGQALSRIQLLPAVVGLVILPCIIYYLMWLPHLHLNVKDSFWGLQQQILSYHNRIKSGPEVHPYCSTWWSWLLMLRPVAYFYRVGIDPHALLPLQAPDAPTAPDAPIFDVHAIGNPILWWSSTLAIAVVLVVVVGQVWQWLIKLGDPLGRPRYLLSPSDGWISIYLLVNYGANLLPWTRVSRCIFLYHYMGASVFATLALAWWCDRAYSRQQRSGVLLLISAIAVAFLFWLPIYLGLPLSATAYKWRMWLPSWI